MSSGSGNSMEFLTNDPYITATEHGRNDFNPYSNSGAEHGMPEFEKKQSTMSSGSGNSMEFLTNDPYITATVHGRNDFNPYSNSGAEHGMPEDFNPYSNSGAEHGMPEINAGYADTNDISFQRKRPLPMPPAFKPLRPRNKSKWFQSFKERCSYLGQSRLVLSITLSLLAMTVVGVVIFLVVTNIDDEPDPPTTPNKTQSPSNDLIFLGSNGTLMFTMPPIQNPDVLEFLQERIGQNVTILHLKEITFNITNRTWTLDGREIAIQISNADKEFFQILISVYISNSQCTHSGKYFVLVNGSNGRAEQSLSYKLQGACLCEDEYELNSSRAIVCDVKVIGSTIVRFDKVSGENVGLIVNQTGISIPDNVPEIGRFSATWKPDGNLITRIYVSPVQCQDEGNYSLTVTSQAGTAVHYTYVKVIDHPENPTINIPEGLIEDKESEIHCQSSTGCRKVNVTLEVTEPNGKDYYPWGKSLSQNHYKDGNIWRTNATLRLTKFEVISDLLQNRDVRCTYSIGGKKYYSLPIHMKLLPADFCKDKATDCEYQHPYDCNKYIKCTSIPVEKHCQTGLHFHIGISCRGNCLHPNEAKCNIDK